MPGDYDLPESAVRELSPEEEIERLVQEQGAEAQDEAPMGGVQLQPPPVTIYVKDADDQEFVVSKPFSWGYHPIGIFANGYWESEKSEEMDVLIPFGRIDWIKFDFAKLRSEIEGNLEQAEATQNEQEQPENPSD